jgi:hypothetical protein
MKSVSYVALLSCDGYYIIQCPPSKAITGLVRSLSKISLKSRSNAREVHLVYKDYLDNIVMPLEQVSLSFYKIHIAFTS